jgi:hypothetical protein
VLDRVHHLRRELGLAPLRRGVLRLGLGRDLEHRDRRGLVGLLPRRGRPGRALGRRDALRVGVSRIGHPREVRLVEGGAGGLEELRRRRGRARLLADQRGQLALHVAPAGRDALDLLERRDRLRRLAVGRVDVGRLDQHRHRVGLPARLHQRVRELQAQARVARVLVELLLDQLDGLLVLSLRHQLGDALAGPEPRHHASEAEC